MADEEKNETTEETETPAEMPAVEESPAVEEPDAKEEAAVVAEPEGAAEVEEVVAEAEEAAPVSDTEPVSDTQETPAAEEAPAEEAVPPPAQSEPKKKRKRLPRALRHKHSKPKREPSATRKPITRTPKQETALGRRQERRGIVVSDKGDKTIVVSVDVTKLHPEYRKVVRRTRKFHAHDEQNQAGVGDVVRIVETRPISKTKNWRLAEVVEKAK